VFLPVTPEDAREIVATVGAGFEGYRAFAPPGWNPPPDIGSVAGTRKRLGDDDVFGLLARTPEGDPISSPMGMPVVEYRRPLPGPAT